MHQDGEVSEKFRRCQDDLTLMQTMLHKYEEIQMRLKSQDEELECVAMASEEKKTKKKTTNKNWTGHWTEFHAEVHLRSPRADR